MEALVALGLAGNVVQFVQFTCKVISETQETYRSAADASAERLDLEAVAEDLRKLISPFQVYTVSIGVEFDRLINSCNKAAGELSRAIQELKVKEGPHRKWRCFSKALLSVWQKEKISSFQKRLFLLRDQIQFHIVDNLSKQQTKLHKDLENLRRELELMNINRGKDLKVIGTNIELISQFGSMLPTKDGLEDVREALQTSISTILNVSKELEILKSLFFTSMEDRHGKIMEAHNATFDWVFKSHELPLSDIRSRINLASWLRSGEGIFWVSGKAGSGKSTFMKWLYSDARTLAALQNWASEDELITASFYFWNAGTDMEKSQQGLLQSLLYELLSKFPELIPTLCTERWDSKRQVKASSPWTCNELSATFSRLSTAALANKKFCFFIDGLDEYDGDHFDLIDTFKAVRSPHIKMCLSSRPWNCFEDAFGKTLSQKLYLQDLTREDIETYAKAKLTMPRYSPSTRKDKILYQQLIVEIGERAQGVFLWVYLVVRSLREGLADGDDIGMLQKRLRSLPTDLELYFKHILASVDLVHKEKVGAIFRLAIEANEPVSLTVHSFMDEDDPDFAINLPIHRIETQEIIDRQNIMQRRINGRTKGLLEVNRSTENVPHLCKTVDFLHRTVHDFLKTKNIEAMLKEMAPPTFNAHSVLSRGFLASFKTCTLAPQDESRMHRVAYFAHRAELFDSTADQAMLEQLEHVCRTRYHMFSSNNVSFLQFAVQGGLVHYVKSILDRKPEFVRFYGPSLLAAALRMPAIESPHVIDLEPMVRLMLERGVSPNRRKGSPSLWTFWLREFPSLDKGVVRFQYWSRIFKMLLSYGARAQDSACFFDGIRKWADDSDGKDIIRHTIVNATAMLLSRGLDPNEPNVLGETFWETFLENLCTDDAPNKTTARTLIQVLSLFLRYGADPTFVQYSRLDFLRLWPKTLSREERTRAGKIRIIDVSNERQIIKCLYLGSSENADVHDFVELLEKEKVYYRSRELWKGGTEGEPRIPEEETLTHPGTRKNQKLVVRSRSILDFDEERAIVRRETLENSWRGKWRD